MCLPFMPLVYFCVTVLLNMVIKLCFVALRTALSWLHKQVPVLSVGHGAHSPPTPWGWATYRETKRAFSTHTTGELLKVPGKRSELTIWLLVSSNCLEFKSNKHRGVSSVNYNHQLDKTSTLGIGRCRKYRCLQLGMLFISKLFPSWLYWTFQWKLRYLFLPLYLSAGDLARRHLVHGCLLSNKSIYLAIDESREVIWS